MYPTCGFHLLKAVCPLSAWGCTPHGGHRGQKLVAMASTYRGAIIWKVMFFIWGHLGGCNRNFPRRLMTGISPKEVLVCAEPVRSCLSLGLPQRQTENSLIIEQLGAKKKRQMEAEDTQSTGLEWSFANKHLWKNSVGEMCPKFWQGWEAMNLGKICWWGRNRGIFYLTTLPWCLLFFHQHIHKGFIGCQLWAQNDSTGTVPALMEQILTNKALIVSLGKCLKRNRHCDMSTGLVAETNSIQTGGSPSRWPTVEVWGMRRTIMSYVRQEHCHPMRRPQSGKDLTWLEHC